MENKVLAKVGNYEVTEAELSFMLKIKKCVLA